MALPPGIQLPIETVWRGATPYPSEEIRLGGTSGEPPRDRYLSAGIATRDLAVVGVATAALTVIIAGTLATTAVGTRPILNTARITSIVERQISKWLTSANATRAVRTARPLLSDPLPISADDLIALLHQSDPSSGKTLLAQLSEAESLLPVVRSSLSESLWGRGGGVRITAGYHKTVSGDLELKFRAELFKPLGAPRTGRRGRPRKEESDALLGHVGVRSKEISIPVTREGVLQYDQARSIIHETRTDQLVKLPFGEGKTALYPENELGEVGRFSELYPPMEYRLEEFDVDRLLPWLPFRFPARHDRFFGLTAHLSQTSPLLPLALKPEPVPPQLSNHLRLFTFQFGSAEGLPWGKRRELLAAYLFDVEPATRGPGTLQGLGLAVRNSRGELEYPFFVRRIPSHRTS